MVLIVLSSTLDREETVTRVQGHVNSFTPRTLRSGQPGHRTLSANLCDAHVPDERSRAS